MQAIRNFLNWLGMKHEWQWYVRKALRMHSPSAAMLDRCRCKRCTVSRNNRPPREVTIYGSPGTIVHLAGASGAVYGTVVLTYIEVWGKGGTSVEFRDRAQLMAERTMTRVHKRGCRKQWPHTEAEGCS